ncbi:Gfo/Idh/MocA family oxidoreductase [Rhodopirellula sp. JC740]|uniref:Gfo/Idh/MocA family oxidoreductase n=1 Tax=Rhodopirellula halodulae TaxID=2894198 RepID=A0ABS8NE69_9BACT|nr:Gfo/Idh/MocA family oxidoreductase [Rhodopirellula sp. JC740]MCC9641845.1 Gfo/Idh/MocA family oxidoreductase [Rhodopirellula sp. JC740]
MQRRHFLAAAAACVSAPTLAQSAKPKLKAVAIGHTGRGNFGHGLDSVWQRLPETDLVAVADGNEEGLQKAQQRLKVQRGFTDYRQMLDEIRPDIVAVCPRHADQHHDMVLASIQSGARGIYVEKPFVRTPAEADSLIAVAKEHGAKIAIAHRNRYHPTLPVIRQMIADGSIGRLLEIRGRGKSDHRGGVEDLWVLGSHVLNLMHYLAGPPESCSASLMQNDRLATASDVREGAEGLGKMAGNALHARYQMHGGVTATFDSIANDGTQNAGFGLRLIGSRGTIAIHVDKNTLAYLLPGNPFETPTEPRGWIPISSAGSGKPEPISNLTQMVEHHGYPARDLLDAIAEDRDPLCSAAEGAMTVEMICAALESHRQNGAVVSFPLKHRDNPLGRYQSN